MTENKIQGKFYPLQHQEWLRACRELTPAQKDVLYYIRTLDPYGDGVDLSVSKIAKQLSTQDKEVHRSTVSRALKALDEKGFIDLELLRVKVRILGKGFHCCDETTVLPTDNSVASTQQARSPRNKRDHDATNVIVTQQTRSPRNNQASKPSQGMDSNSSKTIKTYTDFIKTLSEGEREQFEKFVRIEWKKLTTKNGELGEEIVSLERFLSRAEDIKNWYQRFLNSPAGEEVKKSEVASIDWTQHPEWSNWLAIMREGVPRFVALGTCFDNKTRRAIADWALERGLIWGTES